MEIRGLQRREGRRQIDHAAIGRAGENSQRASNGKAPGFRDRGARSLVDENELWPNHAGQRDGGSFAIIKGPRQSVDFDIRHRVHHYP